MKRDGEEKETKRSDLVQLPSFCQNVHKLHSFLEDTTREM